MMTLEELVKEYAKYGENCAAWGINIFSEFWRTFEECIDAGEGTRKFPLTWEQWNVLKNKVYIMKNNFQHYVREQDEKAKIDI